MSALDARSRFLRLMALDAMHQAGRGHLPSAFSCIDILRVLYDTILRVHPEDPCWPERDRFILSKGHGCLALYAILADKKFFPVNELRRFCRFESRLGGHPEKDLVPGVEASTGSLGHGPSIGIGMALAARLDKRHSRIFVLCGDGETNEGSVWEACLSAAKHKLDTFTLIVDYNKQQSWDNVENILPLEPYVDKFRAFGFAVSEVDGHDVGAMEKLFSSLPFSHDKPSCVICHTVKGKGVAFLEQNLAWHHKTRMTQEEYASMSEELATGQKQ